MNVYQRRGINRASFGGMAGERMENGRKSEIRERQVSTIIGALALVSVIGLGIIMARVFVNTIYFDAKMNILDQIDRATKVTSSGVYSKIAIVTELAKRAAEHIKGPDDKAGYRTMADMLNIFYETQVFTDIGITDTNGTLYGYGGTTFDIRDEPGYQKAIGGKTIISNITKSRRASKPIIVFYAPVMKNGLIVGTISASQEIESMEKWLAQDFFQGYGYCFFVSDNGAVILRSEASKVEGNFANIYDQIGDFIGDPAKAERTMSLIRQDFHSNATRILEISDRKGNAKIIGYASLPDYPEWHILCVVDKNAVIAISFNLIGKVFLFTVYILLIVSALTLLLLKLRKKTQESLFRVAYIDEVTGGYNFQYFKAHAPHLMDKDTRYLILRLDIRHFKYINETLGHDTGNDILRAVSGCLAHHFPESSRQLTARIINDEFIALIRDQNPSDNDPARAILKDLS
jgi:hypothetical protein